MAALNHHFFIFRIGSDSVQSLLKETLLLILLTTTNIDSFLSFLLQYIKISNYLLQVMNNNNNFEECQPGFQDNLCRVVELFVIVIVICHSRWIAWVSFYTGSMLTYITKKMLCLLIVLPYLKLCLRIACYRLFYHQF